MLGEPSLRPPNTEQVLDITILSFFVSSSIIFGIMIVFNVSNGPSLGDSLARSNGLCRCVYTICKIMSPLTSSSNSTRT